MLLMQQEEIQFKKNKMGKQQKRPDTPLASTPEPRRVFTEDERKSIYDNDSKNIEASKSALKELRDKKVNDDLKNVSGSQKDYNNSKAENRSSSFSSFLNKKQ